MWSVRCTPHDETVPEVASMARVVLLGRVVFDQRFWVAQWPPVQNRTLATAYIEDLGGPAAVASATVATLGGSAVFIGPRGDDAVGARVVEFLAGYGVDTTYASICSGAETPVASVIIAPGGERFMFVYAGTGLHDVPDWVSPDALRGADAVLVDSRFPAAAAALVGLARMRGLPAVMDFDADTPATWAVARLATHVIADEELAERVGGVTALLERLRAGGAWGAVTLGQEGVAHRGGRIPAFRVPVHDSTGAGDVFHGAFALALAEGRDPETALVFAAAASALRCKTGQVPHRGPLEELLAEAGRQLDPPDPPRRDGGNR